MTAKVKKIIREIDGLDADDREAVRQHLVGHAGTTNRTNYTKKAANGRGKSLTAGDGHGYNPNTMVTATLRADPPQSLGQQIAEARKKLRLSQTEFGEQVGLSQVGLSNIETGIAMPRLRTLHEIARRLGLRFNLDRVL